MSEPIIHHTTLNTEFKGIRHSISSSGNQVWQFRGIKYANIPTRFRQSTLHEAFSPVYDATSYGPTCPQPLFPTRMEEALIGIPSPIDPSTFDEFECLNLNITVPANTKPNAGLPVMVYVHGGGGFTGSNADWWCDGGGIVKRSVEIGKPVVVVAINYRLSVFGYIGSEELRQVNGKENTANFGLRDIHTSLTWLTHNIAPFGGSPTNLTLYGESHGSAAIFTHLHSLQRPLFHRAITQSQLLGTALFSTPLSLPFASSTYESTKTALGVSTAAELAAVPYQDLIAAYVKSDPRNGMGCMVVMDDVFFPSDWKGRLGGNFAGREILVGCTGNESSVVKMVMVSSPVVNPRPTTASFVSSLETVLSGSKVRDIFANYGIEDTTEAELVADKLLQIVEDACWYNPQRVFSLHAQKSGVKVNQYSFEQKNAFEGPFKGVPAHSLDLAYLHGDERIFDSCEDPEGERRLQGELRDAWIRFANGEGGGEGVKIFGAEGNVKEIKEDGFLSEFRRGEKWGVWEGVGEAELEGLIGLVVVHLSGLLGQAKVEKKD
ncbi:alpha/beta-hydrolase [Mollisia scopiformis]|uniref:Alpha/beta-hydrolase n=1 Tax=Mollisia scopiformis TaxID=149040 RepID=A0A132B460_MOLSC|nr:alpha/beta-hydrolase [Mollisia scopiformis]KUJ07176.1 alpha/beta-hydrolase [Mollisia scopiformis]